MPELCDERQLAGPSYISTRLGFPEDSEAHQSTNTQRQPSHTSPSIGYETETFYEDELGSSGCLQPALAPVVETSGLETVATGDWDEAFTIPSTGEPSGSSVPNLVNDEVAEKHCACIDCLRICNLNDISLWGPSALRCRFPSCQVSQIFFPAFTKHEKSHYCQSGKYTCLEQDCPTITKTFGDLKRHYKTKHCTKADKEQFPCPILWCKYSGKNGFARKDKLKSHYRNMHEGKPGPVKAGRVIKPGSTQGPSLSVGRQRRQAEGVGGLTAAAGWRCGGSLEVMMVLEDAASVLVVRTVRHTLAVHQSFLMDLFLLTAFAPFSL